MIEILEEKKKVLYKSDGNKKRSCVKVACHECGKPFWRAKRSIMRLKGNAYCSDVCKYGKKRLEVKCSYCDKSFKKPKSTLNKSRSGLFFCCREHKDLAQRIENNLKAIWAGHYNESKSTYREKALRHYGRSCSHCSYDEYDICEVHHIDTDRSNNSLKNLIVLCPICHELIHKGFMKVIKRKLVRTNK